MNYKILVVDDEPDIIAFISYNLEKEGYEVYSAGDGLQAIDTALATEPHLILMDVMLPRMDGIEACTQIRTHPRLANTIIAFLTARNEDYSQIAGFEAGGDDYIAKPIRPKVLVSRIKALLKRFENQPFPDTGKNQESDRPLRIDRERYLVIREDGMELTLPRKEFELMALLFSKPQRVFSREEIFSAVWGNDVVVGDRTIDVHIRKLREKIGQQHIVTIKGIGYKYRDD